MFPFQKGVYDESIGSFFRNVDTRYNDPLNIPIGCGQGKISSLKARVSPNIVHPLCNSFCVKNVLYIVLAT